MSTHRDRESGCRYDSLTLSHITSSTYTEDMKEHTMLGMMGDSFTVYHDTQQVLLHHVLPWY